MGPRKFAVFVLFNLLFSIFAFGQGVIVPIICDIRPCPPRPRPQPLPSVLPVKSIRLDTKINGQTATTRVEQVFRNDTPYTLEGTWFFPIPESAAIVEFAIWENDKKLVGEVRSREDARRIYEEIVRRQRDPGLLEYAGRNLFQASIFPIPPNSDKRIELTYTQVLEMSGGAVAYRYPLGMGSRQIEPTLPEGITRRANRPEIASISARIEIMAKGGIRNIYSPTHNIDVARRGDRAASVSFEASGSSEDFELFYTLSNEDIGASLLTYREPGKDGYFLFLVSPRDDLTDRELPNKDVVFVLDTSGSMAADGKIGKAQKALEFGIQTLRPGDRFNVIGFAGDERLMEKGLIEANETGKSRGVNFVAGLRATGGTNINDALLAAINQFRDGDRPKLLVFMTDGIPTVGITDPNAIAASVKSSRAAELGIRIFTFGFGYDVNATLLDQIAADNGGASDYVRPKEDLEVKVSSFFGKVNYPALANVTIDFGSADVELVYPRKVSDLFRGGQMALIGRYRNSSDVVRNVITLRGKVGRAERIFRFEEMNFPLRNEQNDFIPRLWANRRVGWLLEEMRRNGQSDEIRREIVELGTKYGIVTPFTSYLAIDSSAPAPSPMAANASVMAAEKKMRAVSGADAVELSIRQNQLKNSATLAKDKEESGASEENLRSLGSKTFRLQSGTWTDTDYNPELKLPEIVLQFGSREYFDIALKEPELARYFSIGGNVTVVFKGRVYKVRQ